MKSKYMWWGKHGANTLLTLWIILLFSVIGYGYYYCHCYQLDNEIPVVETRDWSKILNTDYTGHFNDATEYYYKLDLETSDGNVTNEQLIAIRDLHFFIHSTGHTISPKDKEIFDRIVRGYVDNVCIRHSMKYKLDLTYEF